MTINGAVNIFSLRPPTRQREEKIDGQSRLSGMWHRGDFHCSQPRNNKKRKSKKQKNHKRLLLSTVGVETLALCNLTSFKLRRKGRRIFKKRRAEPEEKFGEKMLLTAKELKDEKEILYKIRREMSFQ
jgi:hypothetical protein